MTPLDPGELPEALVAQLSYAPETPPQDFVCVICQEKTTNRWKHNPRDYHLPPICSGCEEVTGSSWNGRAKRRTRPSAGSHRDKRNCLQIGALADAIAQEINQIKWRKSYAAA